MAPNPFCHDETLLVRAIEVDEVEEYRRTHSGDPEEIGFSEDELALQFTRQYSDELLFVDEWGRWRRWDRKKTSKHLW